MTKLRMDGSSIAKLNNANGKTIGWVILWDNSELSVLWVGDDYEPVEIVPPIDGRTLEAAKVICTDWITELLETFSAKTERSF